MAIDKLVDSSQLDTDLTSIANAIRAKGGTSAQLTFPNEFVTAINAISGGGGSTLITKTITENGTYTATDDSADGYSEVTVNVPTGGGGGAVSESDVNFYNYDGTILHSYTVAEFNALTEMPSNPTHTGLTAQGWNWSLADAKAYVTKYPEGTLNIGQKYVTDDGKTRFYIHIDDVTPANRKTFYLRFAATVVGGVTINWGDGNSETNTATAATNYSHTYDATGDFIITLTVTSGTISFVGTSGSSGHSVYGSRAITNYQNRGRIRKVEIGNNVTSIGAYAFNNCYSLTSLTIPDGVTSISNYAFQYCFSLTSITIPDSVTSIGGYVFSNCYSLTSLTIHDGVTSISVSAFQYCYSLTSLTIPDGVTSIGNYAFQGCYSLTSLTIPDGVTSIGTYTFQSCYNLTSLTIPDGVTSIGTYTISSCHSLTSLTIPDGVTSINAYAFQSCFGISEYHMLPTTPPKLSNANAFSGIQSDCIIYVPVGCLEAYKTATNWSTYASHMQEESA